MLEDGHPRPIAGKLIEVRRGRQSDGDSLRPISPRAPDVHVSSGVDQDDDIALGAGGGYRDDDGLWARPDDDAPPVVA